MDAAGRSGDGSGIMSAAQRRTMLAMLVLIYAVNFIDRTILNVLVQPIKADLALTDTEIGLVSGVAFGILYGVMGVPFARIAERSSRLNLITLSLGFWSVATAACGLAQNFWHLFAARIGVGVGEAGCTPAAQSMISDAFPRERRATALSIYSLGVPIGTLAGALFGGWVAQEFSWRVAFAVVGLPGVAVALLARLLLREPARGATDGPTIAVDAEVPGFGEVLRTLWQAPAFRYLVLGFTFAATAGYSISLFFVAYLQRRYGISLIDASFAFGLGSGLTGLVGMLVGGVLTDRAARSDRRAQCWVPALALMITAPLIIMALSQPTAWMLAAFIIPAATLYPMYVGPGFAAAHNLVDSRMRATTSAVMLLISTVIGMGLGPVITGMVSDIAARSLFVGDFDLFCRAPQISAECAAAQSGGLMIALISAAACYFAGGICFMIAGFRLGRVQEQAVFAQ